ncbi:MAG: DUF5763 domain-containing protein [Caldilineaceae bacterium]|nr:DUF5763 domain-containing protein [Caldilineaceae bacterium]
MAKTLCKGTRKDGTPCRGVALEKYDGYCLAHGAPPEQAHEWRSSGGKNSATAVRRDKRMPEHLKEPIDHIMDYMQRLAEKDPTPAGLNALSRAAKTLIELRRFANEEMEIIRAEEIRAEAAARLDVQTDLEVLEATDDIRVKRDRFRRESFVEQGFARFTKPVKRDEPPEVLLNEKGRHRFGLQHVEDRQAFLEEVDDGLFDYVRGKPGHPGLPAVAAKLEEVQKDLENTLSRLTRDDEAPYDPMTGQPFTRLPEGVRTVPSGDYVCPTQMNPPEALLEQLSYVKALRRRVNRISESENDKRRQAEQDREAESRTQRETDAGNRSGLETAIEDRTESETDPGNQEEQETGNGDGAKPDKAPGFRFVMERDNRNLAKPEQDHQAD